MYPPDYGSKSESPAGRRRSPISSVGARALVFIVLVCVCLIAMDVWRTCNAHASQYLQMETASSNLARATAQQANDTLKEADTALIGLVERVEVDGTSPAALARLHKLMALRVSQLPQLNGLFIYDERGRWLATSQPTLLNTFNNSDREYFVYHRTHPERGPHIGVPVRSRSTGKWIIPVSRRLDGPDGSFRGVALATIDVSFFQLFYDSLDIGRAGAIALVLDDGVMLLRRPFADSFVGKNVVNTGLFRTYRARAPAGTFYTRSSQDGVYRVNSFRRLDDYPVFVAAALSKDEYLAPWWHDTLLHSTCAVALVAMVGYFGRRLVHQIQLRTLAEIELLRARDALTDANRTLEGLAMKDGLTGLANRRQLDATLTALFVSTASRGEPLSLIMLDVDCFKQFNDIYGHTAGDECLKLVAYTIEAHLRPQTGSLAARYGGEELAVVLPGQQLSEADDVARQICHAVGEMRIEHAGTIVGHVTLSGGVACVLPTFRTTSARELIEAADAALYAAKDAGRNCVRLQSTGRSMNAGTSKCATGPERHGSDIGSVGTGDS